MPIYAYRCERCGHAKDVIQKFSDAPLAICPECGADAFRKQLTAPAFQLKGSGWYVTDFRDGGKKAAKPDAAKAEAKADAKTDGGAPAQAESTKAAEPASSTPAAAPAPAAPKTLPEA
jgi:putative FmdB family regulatory protein